MHTINSITDVLKWIKIGLHGEEQLSFKQYTHVLSANQRKEIVYYISSTYPTALARDTPWLRQWNYILGRREYILIKWHFCLSFFVWLMNKWLWPFSYQLDFMDLNTYEISAHFTCCNADLSLSKVNCSKKKSWWMAWRYLSFDSKQVTIYSSMSTVMK
jgi:hypothetical protein